MLLQSRPKPSTPDTSRPTPEHLGTSQLPTRSWLTACGCRLPAGPPPPSPPLSLPHPAPPPSHTRTHTCLPSTYLVGHVVAVPGHHVEGREGLRGATGGGVGQGVRGRGGQGGGAGAAGDKVSWRPEGGMALKRCCTHALHACKAQVHRPLHYGAQAASAPPRTPPPHHCSHWPLARTVSE
jgi:hypothetical protein